MNANMHVFFWILNILILTLFLVDAIRIALAEKREGPDSPGSKLSKVPKDQAQLAYDLLTGVERADMTLSPLLYNRFFTTTEGGRQLSFSEFCDRNGFGPYEPEGSR